MILIHRNANTLSQVERASISTPWILTSSVSVPKFLGVSWVPGVTSYRFPHLIGNCIASSIIQRDKSSPWAGLCSGECFLVWQAGKPPTGTRQDKREFQLRGGVGWAQAMNKKRQMVSKHDLQGATG